MNAKAMYELEEMLCEELEEFSRKGGISQGDIQPIEQLTTSIKNLKRISEMEESNYSYGDWRANGSYGMAMPPYDPRYSGRRGSRDNGMMNGQMRSDYSGHDMERMESRMRREIPY